MTIEELIAELEDKDPPPPQGQLEAFEAAIEQRLPEDYRRFLIASNGGYLGGRYLFPGPDNYSTFIIREFGGLRNDEAGAPLVGSLRERCDFYQIEERIMPLSMIWIACDPFDAHDSLCLGVHSKYLGQVYYWSGETAPNPKAWNGSAETAGNLTRLANSFTEFVAGLVPNEDQ